MSSSEGAAGAANQGVVDIFDDLFRDFPMQVSHLDTFWTSHSSKTVITQATSALEFDVPGLQDCLTDLSQSYLRIRYRVKKRNAQGQLVALDDGDQVSLINCCGHALFNKLELYLNDQLVSNSNNAYFLRSYLNALLNNKKDTLQSQGALQGFFKDDAGLVDELTYEAPPPPAAGQAAAPEPDMNSGAVLRRNMHKNSRAVEMIIRPNLSMFQQRLPVLSKVNLYLKCFKTPNNVLFMTDSNSDYEIEYIETTFHCKRLKIAENILDELESHLQKGNNAIYKLLVQQEKQMLLPAGIHTHTWDNIWQNRVPAKLVFCMVTEQAMRGDKKLSPLNLTDQELKRFQVILNGTDILCDYNFTLRDSTAAQAYLSLFLGQGFAFKDLDLIIAREDYEMVNSGYFMLVSDLSLDKNGAVAYIDPSSRGTVQIKLEFGLALREPVICHAIGTSQEILEIDADRRIIRTFS
jgi:hypothetical protein